MANAPRWELENYGCRRVTDHAAAEPAAADLSGFSGSVRVQRARS
jgi:hypothetical protein